MAPAVDDVMGSTPRRLILWWGLAALVAAAGLIGARALLPEIEAALDATGQRVLAPEYAWLLLAIPVLIGLNAFSLSDFPWPQRAISFLLKSSAVALITLALVDLRTTRADPVGSAVVFVIDVSESVPDALLERARSKIGETLAEAAALPAEGRPVVRVVVFADRAVEVPLPEAARGPEDVPPLPRLEPTGGVPGTDIGAGLRHALGLFPKGRRGRLVLVSDGHRTRGSLSEDAELLARFGFPVDYLGVDDLPLRRELMVLGLAPTTEAPKPRVPFELALALDATVPMEARCELRLDGEALASRTFALAGGRHEERFEVTIPEGGDRKVDATCEPVAEADDTFKTNNLYETLVSLEEKPKVLYVEGETRFRGNLTTALSTDFDVETRGPRGTPAALSDASRFDLIIVSDVPRVGDSGLDNMTTAQMRTLERYARDGGGLLFLGGPGAFGPGGYGQTALERDVLPVRLDIDRRQEMPGLALVLAMDRSGSMSGNKIELAKKAAMETLNVLQPSDLLGVFPFDTRATELVPLQRASNRFRITDAVSRLRPGGGTNIFGGLDAAYQALVKASAKVKHIILMTDGQSNRNGVVELATQARLDRITISTVAVGSGSDTDLLRRVAKAAGGRYYFTNSPNQLPQLFLKETSEVTRKALVETRFRPKVTPRFRGLQMFSGMDLAAAPPLLGYVSTRAKPQAEVLMTTHLGEPLLARWRLGLGRVVVWTSDVKSRWSQLWLAWPGYAKFWRQVVRDHLRVDEGTPTMALETSIRGDQLVVALDAIDDDDRFIDGMRHAVTATGPDGEARPLELLQVAAGRYEGRLTMDAFGPWTVNGRHHAPGTPDDDPGFESRATIVWPFPDEYRSPSPDLGEIAALAARTGGVEAPTAATLTAPIDGEILAEAPTWPRWLPWVLVLLVLDVTLRRIRFGGSAATFK